MMINMMYCFYFQTMKQKHMAIFLMMLSLLILLQLLHSKKQLYLNLMIHLILIVFLRIFFM